MLYMDWTWYFTSNISFNLYKASYEIGAVIPILQMRKLRLRSNHITEVTQLTSG